MNEALPAPSPKKKKAKGPHIPWKTMAENLAAVGAGHLAGYYGAGLLDYATGQRGWKALGKLAPAKRKAMLRSGLSAVGTLASLSALTARRTQQARIQGAIDKHYAQNKTASVIAAYDLALKELNT